MAEERDRGVGLVAGGIGGTLLGATITALLLGKPVEAATPEEKLDYLIECLTALVPVLAEVAAGNAQLIVLMQQWLAAQGIPPADGVEVTVKTPWVAKEPLKIYQQVIRSAGPFQSDVMVDMRNVKRLSIRAESSLDVVVTIQPVGNFADSFNLAVNVGLPAGCPINGEVGFGLAWGDWMPYIGVLITPVGIPTTGLLTIWVVAQE